MLGLTFTEIFFLLGATAAILGPKDLPIIARSVGRLVGRSIGTVQKFRGQFDSVMHQSQAAQVNKEVQEMMEQMVVIRREVQRMGSISSMNPVSLGKRLIDNPDLRTPMNDSVEHRQLDEEYRTIENPSKEYRSAAANLQSQAAAFERLAKSSSLTSGMAAAKPLNDAAVFKVLPISAEDTKFLPKRTGDVKGSDIMLEAIIEAEVAENAKNFFTQPQNQIN